MTLNITDWAMIESDYIHGYYITSNRNIQKHIYPTIDMLASKYDVSPSAVNRRSKQDKWVIRREQYKEKIREKTFDKSEHHKIDVLLSESSKYDTQNLQKLDQIDDLLNRYFYKFTSKVTEEDDTPETIDLKELDILMNILLKRHQLSRNIFGEPSTTKAKEKQQHQKQESPAKKQSLDGLVESMRKNESLKERLLKEKAKLLELSQNG